jgi:hypothetical protein
MHPPRPERENIVQGCLPSTKILGLQQLDQVNEAGRGFIRTLETQAKQGCTDSPYFWYSDWGTWR